MSNRFEELAGKRIIEIAHLVEFLIREDVSVDDKVAAIHLDIDNGILTADEGLELVIEYTY